jgi:hypothetical protein
VTYTNGKMNLFSFDQTGEREIVNLCLANHSVTTYGKDDTKPGNVFKWV